MFFFHETHRVLAKQSEALRAANGGNGWLDGLGVHRVGLIASQAEQDSAVGAMPQTRGRERTKEFCAHAMHRRKTGRCLKAAGKLARRNHRPHGVRA